MLKVSGRQQGQALLWLVIMKANATVTQYLSALVSTWLAEIMRERWYKGSLMFRLPLALLGLLSVVKCPFSQLKEKSLELFL